MLFGRALLTPLTILIFRCLRLFLHDATYFIAYPNQSCPPLLVTKCSLVNGRWSSSMVHVCVCYDVIITSSELPTSNIVLPICSACIASSCVAWLPIQMYTMPDSLFSNGTFRMWLSGGNNDLILVNRSVELSCNLTPVRSLFPNVSTGDTL